MFRFLPRSESPNCRGGRLKRENSFGLVAVAGDADLTRETTAMGSFMCSGGVVGSIAEATLPVVNGGEGEGDCDDAVDGRPVIPSRATGSGGIRRATFGGLPAGQAQRQGSRRSTP